MRDFKSLVAKDLYLDTPYFSDELLLPSIASGNHVTLLTAFVPSYLFRLVNDLATSPQIERGGLEVVFCVPVSPSEGLSQARVFSKYLCGLATSSRDVKKFLESSLQLVGEGKLRFSALFSRENQRLTPSCIGLIESGEYGSNDYVGLIDALAGDGNSPIPVHASWENSSVDLGQIVQLVSDAKFRQFPTLYRIGHEDLVSIFREILKKGYPKQDLLHIDSTLVEAKKGKTQSPGVTRATRHEELPETDFDTIDDSDLLDVDFEIEKILLEVFIRENDDVDLNVIDFFGSEIDESLIQFQMRRDSGRGHIGPLPVEIVELVGHGFATCWCGETFDREAGCSQGSE